MVRLLMCLRSDETAGMKNRYVLPSLWFYVTWTAWSLIASTLAFDGPMSLAGGLILGVVAAAFVARDPRHMFWTPRRPVSRGTAMLPSTQRLHNA
jgi:hypothetical protein